MKKSFLIIFLLITSSFSFADVNFSNSTGDLVMRDVSIDDGLAKYDSVTLNMNLNTGKFTIVKATEKAISPFLEVPSDTFTKDGLKIDLHGCAETGRDEITCMTKIVSLEDDNSIIIGGTFLTQMFDNLGRQYNDETTSIFNEPFPQISTITIIQGIPVEVKFTYKNIDPAATSIALFKPYFANNTTSALITPEFKDISIIK